MQLTRGKGEGGWIVGVLSRLSPVELSAAAGKLYGSCVGDCAIWNNVSQVKDMKMMRLHNSQLNNNQH